LDEKVIYTQEGLEPFEQSVLKIDPKTKIERIFSILDQTVLETLHMFYDKPHIEVSTKNRMEIYKELRIVRQLNYSTTVKWIINRVVHEYNLFNYVYNEMAEWDYNMAKMGERPMPLKNIVTDNIDADYHYTYSIFSNPMYQIFPDSFRYKDGKIKFNHKFFHLELECSEMPDRIGFRRKPVDSTFKNGRFQIQYPDRYAIITFFKKVE